MLASACRRLISANAARFLSSRRNSCTTAIPDRFSCRNALIRATHRRVSRNELRAPLRNQFVTAKKRGMTANVTRASRQLRLTITAMMPTRAKRSPKTVTTPEVKSSLTASTSVVTRVMSRPTGLRSK